MIAKRLFDLCFSIIAFVFFFPLIVGCMFVLLLTGEHKIWFCHERVGRGGKRIRVIKFVTMRNKRSENEMGDITLENDPRILPLGRLLCMSKINELPQLINVLLGSMSIVGPRPLTENLFSYYTPEVQSTIVNLKPGITGIGSILFRKEDRYTAKAVDAQTFYRENISPYKGSLEMWYAQHVSVKTDMKLIIITAWVILSPESNLPHRWLKDLPAKPEWMN